jgi:hypothetical protein
MGDMLDDLKEDLPPAEFSEDESKTPPPSPSDASTRPTFSWLTRDVTGALELPAYTSEAFSVLYARDGYYPSYARTNTRPSVPATLYGVRGYEESILTYLNSFYVPGQFTPPAITRDRLTKSYNMLPYLPTRGVLTDQSYRDAVLHWEQMPVVMAGVAANPWIGAGPAANSTIWELPVALVDQIGTSEALFDDLHYPLLGFASS